MAAAAARAFLQGVVTAGRGRGRAGPDPLATEVAAAGAAAKAGKAGPLTDAAAPPPAALPVWDGEAIAPAALAAAARAHTSSRAAGMTPPAGAPGACAAPMV